MDFENAFFASIIHTAFENRLKMFNLFNPNDFEQRIERILSKMFPKKQNSSKADHNLKHSMKRLNRRANDGEWIKTIKEWTKDRMVLVVNSVYSNANCQ